MTLEYTEEWAGLEHGWDELLNKYADDGWRLAHIVIDEHDTNGRVAKGRCRLIFEREASDG